jgi:hypothetical protein
MCRFCLMANIVKLKKWLRIACENYYKQFVGMCSENFGKVSIWNRRHPCAGRL